MSADKRRADNRAALFVPFDRRCRAHINFPRNPLVFPRASRPRARAIRPTHEINRTRVKEYVRAGRQGVAASKRSVAALRVARCVGSIRIGRALCKWNQFASRGASSARGQDSPARSLSI